MGVMGTVPKETLPPRAPTAASAATVSSASSCPCAKYIEEWVANVHPAVSSKIWCIIDKLYSAYIKC